MPKKGTIDMNRNITAIYSPFINLETCAYAKSVSYTHLDVYKRQPFTFERRNNGPHDVRIEILYCGVCHSDIHQVRNEWGGSKYPMVPGHEIVGRVTEVGSQVTQFKVAIWRELAVWLTHAALVVAASKTLSNIAKTALWVPTTAMN